MLHLQTRLLRFIEYQIFPFTLGHCNNNIKLFYEFGGGGGSLTWRENALSIVKKNLTIDYLVAYKLLREQISSSTLSFPMHYEQGSNCLNLQWINYLVECDQNSIIIIIIRHFRCAEFHWLPVNQQDSLHALYFANILFIRCMCQWLSCNPQQISRVNHPHLSLFFSFTSGVETQLKPCFQHLINN